MKRKIARKNRLIIGSVIAVLAIGGASARTVFSGTDDQGEIVMPVVQGTVEEAVVASAVLEPARLVNVGAQVSGQLKNLHVELGQKVRQGDLIGEVDSTPQTNGLRIANAALANLKAQRRARDIKQHQAEIAYNRQKTLNSANIVSTANRETAEAAFRALQAEVEALDAQILQASVEVENAEVNLGYTKVRAPIDGTVVAVVTKAGQTLNAVQAAPTIVSLAQLGTMRVKVQVSETDIGRVRVGQNVRFTIMGYPDSPISAKLEQIEPAPTTIAADSTTGTSGAVQGVQAVYYNGLFKTPNADGRLRPMMTASVRIIVGKAENVPLVPWSALTHRDEDGRYHVRVRQASGAAVEKLVTVGLTDKINSQIIDGLSVGDKVIIPAEGETSTNTDMVTM
ncbi:efflux RND transporter periplasmic adaptor subunit [Agrobacterium salinitolerans]|uniref:Efflux RND transporter periplasmic adaptor subunit n=1 Tax=Agrobacterium salinitolerans TaxID=1183413 RepID=A0A9X9KDS5_9HYPH|nr:efflux RND transporter periplasmic adaptor subunit [Agrobacterium salinitolerans]UYZ09578.1 efflux RND transporter periplasmic adaptor subunit [Agrobacterium salinitolerans]